MKQVIRSLYRNLPFKQPVFEAVRTLYRPSEGIYKHLHFQGDISIKIDESHSFKIRHYGFEVENSLFWAGIKGGWEKNSISLWLKLVRQADVVFDIGANTGIYSLITKSLNSHSQVFAFEPIQRVFLKLKANNRLNNYDIECFECAISNTDGTATVFDLLAEHVYSVTVNKNLNSPETNVVPTEIKVKRLDTFIEETNIEKIDLMKIDVETHEPEVLEGMGVYLDKFRPTMLIEILNDEVGKKVERLVEGKNYLYFNLDEKSNSIKRTEGITKSDYYNFLLCNETTAMELGLIL